MAKQSISSRFHVLYGVLLLLCTDSAKCFIWLENNDIGDCVCGISYYGRPIGVGVFFDRNLVLTSATPVEEYIYYLRGLRVHAIYGAFYNGRTYYVQCATHAYPASREPYWSPIGTDQRHSGIHDLAVLYVPSPWDYDLAPEASNASYRHAFSMLLATWNHRMLTKGFLIPAFGFIDEDHVRRMDVMEMEIYDEEVLLDCDDYIPRDWGRFICISNLRNATGIQSGAPLIHRGLVYGIGSFALEKGDEKILVFTDVRDYISNLHYCYWPVHQQRWISKYWGVKHPK